MQTTREQSHILLLGPPAVGKFTIGQLLSNLTAYPLFDNSRTVDMAQLLYEYGSTQYRAYRDELRFAFYDKAIRSEIKGLISTGCLRRPNGWNYLMAVESRFREFNWKTHYFLLVADKDTLIKRAESRDRNWKRSLTNRKQIEEWIETSPLHSLTAGHSCYRIDVTLMEPLAVAKQIAQKARHVT